MKKDDIKIAENLKMAGKKLEKDLHEMPQDLMYFELGRLGLCMATMLQISETFSKTENRDIEKLYKESEIFRTVYDYCVAFCKGANATYEKEKENGKDE